MTVHAAYSPVSLKAVPAFLRPSWLNRTIAYALFLSAAMVCIEAWQMWHVREAALHNAKIVSASLAESLGQQIENSLKTADTVVATLVQRVEAEGVNPESEQRLYELMTSLASALPAIHEMGLTDKDGNAIVKSLVPHPVGMNYRERDYFRFLSSHDTRDAFIGQPVKSKVDGSINITVSRRVNAQDGSFAGVVVTSVSMNFFRKLFETVQLTSDGFIGLYADSGMLLVSSPDHPLSGELTALAAAPYGSLEYLSPESGMRRVGTFDHLSHDPMTVMVSQSSAAVLTEWHRQLRVHGATVACVLLIIGALGYRVDQANRHTRLHALCDGLTGLANRRCFDKTIERETRRAARNGRPLSLIMVDVDFFKAFNDRYGHVAGDACLRSVAQTLRGVLRRAGDTAARYGGEEFTILLPETDESGAIRIVNEITAAVRALAIENGGSSFGVVTLSAGIACWRRQHGPVTPAWLIEAADAALYQAKANGRNAFSVHLTAGAGAPLAVIERNAG